MGLHKDVGETNMHEPKNMTTATGGASDIGKVVVSKGDGTSEVRKLTLNEIGDGPVYGEMEIIQNSTVIALTAAGDATLYTDGEYINVTGLFTEGTMGSVTFASDALTIPVTGVYLLNAWATIESSVSNVTIGLKFTANGTPSPSVATPTLRRKVGAGGDKGVVSASGLVTLSAGDAIGIAVASDGNTNLLLADGTVVLMLLKQTA